MPYNPLHYIFHKIQKMSFKMKRMLAMLFILVIMAVLSFQRNVYADVVNVVIALFSSVFYNKKTIENLVKSLNKKRKVKRREE